MTYKQFLEGDHTTHNTQTHNTTHNTQTHNTLHTTHNTQHETHNTTQHETHNTQHTTHYTLHTTHNTQHTNLPDSDQYPRGLDPGSFVIRTHQRSHGLLQSRQTRKRNNELATCNT